MRFIALFLFVLISIPFASNSNELAAQQSFLDSLKREVEALKRIKLERASVLERAETVRWQNRYTQNRNTQEYQNETRALEGRYAKTSDDISRAATELGSLRNLVNEQKDRATAAKNSLENFYLQVKQAIDKSIEEIPQDFPAKTEERMLNFANNPETIETYFQDRLARLTLTSSQEFTSKDTHRLRLGTVFFADVDPSENGETRAVLRTGSLQGKVFEWRANMSKELSSEIRQSVFAAQQGKNLAWIPIDVLQTKSVLGANANTAEQSYSQKLAGWFKAGGIVMYPLMLIALFSLLIAAERGFMMWKRGHISKTFTSKLHALIKNSEISEAGSLCKKQGTCLGKILGAIVENSGKRKELAQKSLQEILLAEQSKLEKRMGFLAALGTVAPLLGLLGTVTGMITLFQVITQVGTNDARILAGGISEALITTETGLIIAIPVMLLHGKLSETLDYITAELRIQSLAIFNMLWKND
ncbi:MAG: MotA/TolQ/ExbB proton channel family protein [Fibromonadaceae bacterium]|jgi:biopolymer transport protein ExbB|nr:MotA/TolQ/ExbB proton channel family protein [Fibromonadaceae bacterium]